MIDLPLMSQLTAYLFWVIAYILIIRKGFQDKTYGMPFFAMTINFPWEVNASISSLLDPGVQIQTTLANIFWAGLDVLILVTYFRYGFRYFYKGFEKWHFYTWSILQLAICTIILYIFAYEFGGFKGWYFSGVGRGGMYYTGVLMCLNISLTYLHMVASRSGLEGQSLGIWFFRTMGTLATAFYYGYFYESMFAAVIFFLCFPIDLIYLYIFLRKQKLIVPA